ncbi:MAG: hypothetical protein HY699_03045 [Deltaproteobacteria bacterium]|nr:hypothetical protein [Deltaproteobacteria bacterium]
MKPRVIVVIAALLAMLVAATAMPNRARAADMTTPLLIGVAAVGGVLLLSYVAVKIIYRDKVHFLAGDPASLPRRETQPRQRVRFAADCPTTADGPALVCW